MQINVTGVDAEIKRISKLIQLSNVELLRKKSDKILKDLVEATPIDTGAARAGWIATSTALGVTIINDVEYIEQLNNGHSQQAPVHFVESVLLNHGKPLGTIIDTPR